MDKLDPDIGEVLARTKLITVRTQHDLADLLGIETDNEANRGWQTQLEPYASVWAAMIESASVAYDTATLEIRDPDADERASYSARSEPNRPVPPPAPRRRLFNER